MPIANPTPVTPGPCGTYWVSDITLSNPLLTATLRPYDGQHFIGNVSLAKRITVDTSTNASAKAAVDAVLAQGAALSGKAVPAKILAVNNSDPLQPVVAVVIFTDNSIFKIPDLFACMSANAAVAAAYEAVVAFLATAITPPPVPAAK